MRARLIVVSGPPGSGKTALARTLADAIGCPMISRDAIKEELAASIDGYSPAPGDELAHRTLATFFDAIAAMLDAGITVVAEAAFQHDVWRPRLDALADRGHIVVIECRTDEQVRRRRVAERVGTRPVHADTPSDGASFERLTGPYPMLTVDTTDGYGPPLDVVRDFALAPARDI